MALTAIERRQRPDVVTTTGGRQGGGKTGAMAGLGAGAVLGGLAAAAVPGAAPAAIAMGAVGGAGAGSSLGGMLGEKVKPTQEASSAMQRRAVAQAPQQINGSEKIKEAIMALHEAPPDAQQQYAPQLVQGYLASLAKERNGAGSV